jgi:hypothetical protein
LPEERSPVSDAFLSLKSDLSGDATVKHYFLDVFDDSRPFFTFIRRVKQYIDYSESGEWAVTELDFPSILFICESDNTEKRLQKQIAKLLYSEGVDDVIFATTTRSLIDEVSCNIAIWRRVHSDDLTRLVSLSEIS